jgi:hypothetical protein
MILGSAVHYSGAGGGLIVVNSAMSWFHDSLAVWIIAGIVGLIIFGVAVVLIAASNLGSRNIGVATGALAGALILYLVQVPFELQRTVEVNLISVEYTIDRVAPPSIRQYRDYRSGGAPTPPSPALFVDVRVPFEIAASQWLAAHNPSVFATDRDRVLSDFVIFNLLGFILSNEFDWQIKKQVYRGAGDIYYKTQPVSPRSQCTMFTDTEVRARLVAAGNLFAEAPFTIGMAWLCLPPRSTLQVADGSLVLRNPICELSFSVDLKNRSISAKPQRQAAPQPGGSEQLETHLFGLEATATYFPLRAQHGNMATYRAWLARIVDGAHKWFEP